MLLTAQAPVIDLAWENKPIRKKKLENVKSKKAAEITVISKSFDDWYKCIMLAAAKLCGVSKGWSKTKNVAIE